ncbi:MAG: hypothetical protein LBJ59_03125, partial [Zoogloeaceae bacterium]|nr:hypothetical protein [Zoogloeaceae bacterium]
MKPRNPPIETFRREAAHELGASIGALRAKLTTGGLRCANPSYALLPGMAHNIIFDGEQDETLNGTTLPQRIGSVWETPRPRARPPRPSKGAQQKMTPFYAVTASFNPSAAMTLWMVSKRGWLCGRSTL